MFDLQLYHQLSTIVFSLYCVQEKGDFKRSEEYYERAILAEPNNGEVLSQYAQLQWNVHGDKDRAEIYYNQALEAAPEDWYEYHNILKYH